jgi:hypothetical protein
MVIIIINLLFHQTLSIIKQLLLQIILLFQINLIRNIKKIIHLMSRFIQICHIFHFSKLLIYIIIYLYFILIFISLFIHLIYLKSQNLHHLQNLHHHLLLFYFYSKNDSNPNSHTSLLFLNYKCHTLQHFL